MCFSGLFLSYMIHIYKIFKSETKKSHFHNYYDFKGFEIRVWVYVRMQMFVTYTCK